MGLCQRQGSQDWRATTLVGPPTIAAFRKAGALRRLCDSVGAKSRPTYSRTNPKGVRSVTKMRASLATATA